ncbi:hypothetical protein Hdeb2414_s0010g00334171 [Helianthus debilis subsp. tardiflorus]
MERALNGTKMGGGVFKLKVNLSKFASENSGLHGGGYDKQKEKMKEQVKPHQEPPLQNLAFVNNGERKSFRDLFNNPRGGQEGTKCQEESVGRSFTIPDDMLAFKEILGKALVGRCKDVTTLRALNSLLAEVEVQGVSLSYLGGLFVVMKFVNEVECNNFLLNHIVWDVWFSSLDIWMGRSLPFETLAWVRVIDIPIRLADNNVFDGIAGRFGKIVHGSSMSEDDNNLSFSLIGILVGDGDRIRDHVSVRWKSITYRVWIEEESGEWTPDCLGAVEVPKHGCNTDNVSEEKEDEAGPVIIGSVTKTPEVLVPVRVDEKVGENQEGGGTGNLNNNVFSAEGDGSDSHHVGTFKSNHDVFDKRGGNRLRDKGVFFFNPADNNFRRPKRTMSRIRLRHKANSHPGNCSPNSEERPKKKQGRRGI